MKNIFTNHPHSVGESYFQHLKAAFKFGFLMLVGGAACIIHAIFPFAFKKTASQLLIYMTTCFVNRSASVEEKLACLSRLIQQKMES